MHAAALELGDVVNVLGAERRVEGVAHRVNRCLGELEERIDGIAGALVAVAAGDDSELVARFIARFVGSWPSHPMGCTAGSPDGAVQSVVAPHS